MLGFIGIVVSLFGAIGATVWLTVSAQRRLAPARFVTAGATTFLCGLLSTGFISIHLVSVIGRAAEGKGFGGEAAFAYDFRFYSLILLGVVVFVPAVICVMNARKLTTGDPDAWYRVLVASGMLALINLPLMPIQPNAIGPAVTATAAFVAVLARRRPALLQIH